MLFPEMVEKIKQKEKVKLEQQKRKREEESDEEDEDDEEEEEEESEEEEEPAPPKRLENLPNFFFANGPLLDSYMQCMCRTLYISSSYIGSFEIIETVNHYFPQESEEARAEKASASP